MRLFKRSHAFVFLTANLPHLHLHFLFNAGKSRKGYLKKELLVMKESKQ